MFCYILIYLSRYYLQILSNLFSLLRFFLLYFWKKNIIPAAIILLLLPSFINSDSNYTSDLIILHLCFHCASRPTLECKFCSLHILQHGKGKIYVGTLTWRFSFWDFYCSGCLGCVLWVVVTCGLWAHPEEHAASLELKCKGWRIHSVMLAGCKEVATDTQGRE